MPRFRVLVRHGWLDATATYDEARDLVVEHADDAADRAANRKRWPLCRSCRTEWNGSGVSSVARPRRTVSGCPLERLLPEGGPREVDA